MRYLPWLLVAACSGKIVTPRSVDLAPVVTEVTAGAIAFAAPPGSTCECSLDGAPFSACASPFRAPPLDDGEHQLRILCAGEDGVTGEPVVVPWTLDTTPPTLAIIEKPAALTRETSAAITFFADAVRFLCQLDGGQEAACTSPFLVAVGEGPHVFSVRAFDDFENVTAPAVATWEVDATAPEVTLSEGPPFLASCNEVCEFLCALDGADEAPCDAAIDGPFGTHTLIVRAKDAAGNLSAPVSASWQTVAAEWQKVALGLGHACALATSGDVYCWGSNYFGQLGRGEAQATPPLPPHGDLVAIEPRGQWIDVDASQYISCALNTAHELYCWGVNNYGELGPEPTALGGTFRATPTRINGDTDWATFGVGGSNVCAIKTNGMMYCWGHNGYGQLNVDAMTTPTSAEPLALNADTDWASVKVGTTGHACGFKQDGRLFCWGYNGGGQAGPGTGTGNTPSPPTEVFGEHDDWSVVSVLNQATCGLRQSQLHCFGWKFSNGNVPDPCDLSAAEPVCEDTGRPGTIGEPELVTMEIDDWKSLGGEGNLACGIRADDHAYCWGALADGVIHTYPQPVPGDVRFRSVEGSSKFACGLSLDGALYCWGNNGEGQLGQGHMGTVLSPVAVGDDTDWATVSTGTRSTCATKTDGRLFCWGDGVDTPQALAGDDWLAVHVQDTATCGLRESGDLSCWGSAPLAVTNGAWTRFGASLWGSYFALLGTDLLAWGRNSSGELGAGDNAASPTPRLIGTGFNAAAQLNGNGCGIDVDGKLFCWGAATAMLGLGPSPTAQPTPIQIGTDTDWKRSTGYDTTTVAVGTNHVCALKDDGGLYCWGSNYSGEVGNGTVAPVDTPTLIGGGYTAVAAGGTHSCALTAGGEVSCWGNNVNGQVGDGTLDAQKVPYVLPLDHIVSIAAGGGHSCAIREESAERRLYCWGWGAFGQIGDGNTYRFVPVRVTHP